MTHSGEPAREALAAIAERHGLPAGAVRRMPAGVANHVYQLGADLVLRIPRVSAFVPDLRKEAAIIPAARRLGVRTPAMVSYDDTCSIVAVPYMVLERAPGTDLGQHSPPPEKAATLLRDVGRQLGMLHRGASALAAEVPNLPADREADDPEVLVTDLLDTGHIDAGVGATTPSHAGPRQLANSTARAASVKSGPSGNVGGGG